MPKCPESNQLLLRKTWEERRDARGVGMGEAYVNFTPMSATNTSCLQLHKGMRTITPLTRTISITHNLSRLDYEPSNQRGLGLEALHSLDYQRKLCSRCVAGNRERNRAVLRPATFLPTVPIDL